MFRPQNVKKIVTLLARSLTDRAKTQMEIELRVSDAVKNYIVETAYDPKYGARPLRRKLQNKVEDPLAEEILSGRIKRGDVIDVTLKKNEIAFVKKPKAEKTANDRGGKKDGSDQ